jgi:hypothetical protein
LPLYSSLIFQPLIDQTGHPPNKTSRRHFITNTNLAQHISLAIQIILASIPFGKLISFLANIQQSYTWEFLPALEPGLQERPKLSMVTGKVRWTSDGSTQQKMGHPTIYRKMRDAPFIVDV